MQMKFAIRCCVWTDCIEKEVNALLRLRSRPRTMAQSNFGRSRDRFNFVVIISSGVVLCFVAVAVFQSNSLRNM